MCGSITLRHDKSVKKGAVIHCFRDGFLFGNKMILVYLQEAEECNKTFQQTWNHVLNQDAVDWVFSQLVVQGK